MTGNKNPSKAVNIKKKGTYRVISKSTNSKKNDYIRFTAPKKGTYTLTFSDFRNLKNYSDAELRLGYVYIEKKDKHGIYCYQNVKSQGGKITMLNVCSKVWYNAYIKGKKITKRSELYSRYAKISLKKGETIYIESFWTGGPHSYSLKIK